MSVIRIAVPVTRIKTRLTLNVGRPWSVIEHIILEAIVRAPHSIEDIERSFCIPRAVVEGALMRLLRVEWIQMTPPVLGPLRFEPTTFGARACVAEKLPYVGKHVERTRSQIVERLTGHVFKPTDLRHTSRSELMKAFADSPTEILRERLPDGMYCADEIVEVALEENEELLTIDSTGDPWPNRLALFEVSENQISGLPQDRPLDDLRAALLRAASAVRAKGVPSSRPLKAKDLRTPLPKQHRIRFEPTDVVVGGPQHHDAILDLLRTAVTRVIIHTTFLDPQRFRDLLPEMIEAIKARNVRIDILWGQEPPPEEEPPGKRLTAMEAAQLLRKDPNIRALAGRLHIHSVCTHSHAKVIVADPKQPGHFVALVGSCNWLSSPFLSIEASIYLREPSIVREVAQCLLRLCYSSTGNWAGLASDLLALIEDLRNKPRTRSPNGKAALVVGDAHNAYMLRARDQAKRAILLTSNRLGRFFLSGALTPLAEACAPRKIQAKIFYSLLQGIGRIEESQFARDAATRNIPLKPINHPKVHAKILAWDDNTAVITSQNWLSADPGPNTLATELGVAIDAPWVGKIVRDQFNACVRPVDRRDLNRHRRSRGRRSTNRRR
jgi:cardiolipin synthase A/B